MTYIDVFNGDADGILSLIQWRQAYPLTAQDTQVLITGVKRDIALVSQIDDRLANDATITVLDVSFDKNANDVKRVLPHCHSLYYCDHHQAKRLFEHDKLTTNINTAPTVCTGLLVNSHLTQTNPKLACPLWAIAAAYGDGLDNIADNYAKHLALSEAQRQQLKQLGVLVNYNGYGSAVADLHCHPATLYQRLMAYATPFDVVADKASPFIRLQQGYEADMAKVKAVMPLTLDQVITVILDDAPWARRISGTYGNQLAASNPENPIVVVTSNQQGSYTISLRAPKNNPYGASNICGQFATGGGREGAAGINALPVNELEGFIAVVRQFYNP